MNEGDFTERMIAMQPRLYRVSAGILSRRADQEDAVQSCLQRAWRKLQPCVTTRSSRHG